MKIYLKQDWAKFVDYSSKDNIFVGRGNEIKSLKAYIINNQSGSILISGERGHGKTSFVYKAIQELNLYYSDKVKFIPILINTSQLNLEKETLYTDLLKNLIRRLFSKLKDEKSNKDLDILYKKIQGEYYASEDLITEVNTLVSASSKKIFNTIFRKEINQPWFLQAINYLSLITGTVLVATQGALHFKLLGVLLLLLPSISISYSLEKVNKIKTENIEKKSAKEFYKRDNSIGNLEHDLKEFLITANKKYKFLFVIDELDKVDDKLKIFNLIQLYKNLFTLSKANYIFITDQKIYIELMKADKGSDTTPTLFNFKIFLMELFLSDFNSYFNSIISNIYNEEKYFSINEIPSEIEKDYLQILNFFIFESKFDIFYLKELLNNYINYDNEYKPYLDIDEIYLENNKKIIGLKSFLIQIISQIYKAHRYSSLHNMCINQNNLQLLFKFIRASLDNKISYDLNDSKVFILDVIDNTQILSEFTDSAENHLFDFLNLATRYGMLSYSGDDTNRLYEWSGKLPISIKDKPRLLFKNEESFVNHFDQLITIVNDLDNIEHNRTFGDYNYISEDYDASEVTGKPIFETYQKYLPYYVKLNREIPEYIPIENLKQYTKDTQVFIKSLLSDFINISSNLLLKYLNNYNYTNFIISTTDEPQLLSSAQFLKDKLQSFEHKIIRSDNYSKQIIIIKDFKFDIQPEEMDSLDEQNKILLIINGISDIERTPRSSYKYQYQKQIGTTKSGKPRYRTKSGVIESNLIEYKFENNFRIYPEIFDRVQEWLE